MKTKMKFLIAGLAVLMLLVGITGVASAVTGAISTTDNPSFVGPDSYVNQECLNGQGVNCNIYLDKRDVWFSGLPVSAALGDGTYFFAVLSPGGQAAPNDGGTNQPNGELANLSDNFDSYTNRTFTVDGNGNITNYSGTHNRDGNLLQLFSYADTPNPGGEYILAVCKYDPNDSKTYPVKPSDCKYDAFKIKQENEVISDLVVTKDANPSFTRTFGWDIVKSVDNTQINIADGGTATFNYSVAVTKKNGVDSDWKVDGTIQVFNPNNFGVTGVDVTDEINDGNADCTVTDGSDVTIAAGDTASFTYTCTYSAAPDPYAETNTASATWPNIGSPNTSASFSFDFEFGVGPTPPNPTLVNDCVTVNDTFDGTTAELGKTCASTTYTYSHTVSGVAGTCTDYNNTAEVVEAQQSASQKVTVCVGADLTVEKDATPTFTRTYTWDISKGVDPTVVKKIGGTAMFNYTVNAWQTGFTDSDWAVAGTITVTNPNDWEAITFDAADTVPSGECTVIDGTAVELAASASVDLSYSCTFADQPAYNTDLTNTATATWDGAAYYTPDSTANGEKKFQFTTPTTLVNQTVTVTDTFNGGLPETLGTLTATDATPYASATFSYSHTVNVPTWNCKTYDNTAKVIGDDDVVLDQASQTVKVCGPAKTGALTMGFWKNTNGNSLIQNYCAPSDSGKASLALFLSGLGGSFNGPFKDATGKTCSQLVTYVNGILSGATATDMNKMLKAQMLATALDVYFSSQSMGYTTVAVGRTKPPSTFLPGQSLGAFNMDLTAVCPMVDNTTMGAATCKNNLPSTNAFASGAVPNSSMNIINILEFAATSPVPYNNGVWYGGNRTKQEILKNIFDQFNNQMAFVAP